MPTSGGLYWWTHYFASENTRRPLCFLVGYSNTLGLVGGLCSIDCKGFENEPHLQFEGKVDGSRWFFSHVPIGHRDCS